MSENAVNYDAVLADLIARRDQLNAAIAAIQAIAGVSSGSAAIMPGTGSITMTGAAPKIEPDAFFGLTVLDASTKFLGMMKRPQTSRTITDALQNGGYNFNSGDPITTVASILNRSDLKGGAVVRVGKGLFGLAEWYKSRPNRKRTNGDASDAGDPGDTDAGADQQAAVTGDSPPVDPFK